MFEFFSDMFRSALRFIERIGRKVEEFLEDQELEPEQIEEAINIIVRIVLTYRIFIARVVEVFVSSVINTIKEYQWEPLQP